ncbi:MAG: hypothetical protein K6T91_08865 [Firmicutes bacterium]|nr:hypothetical protein [Bacillota bacterium]
MSIRPTDLQIIIQKMQEVERLQQVQQQQPKTQQQQFAAELLKKSEEKERQVNSSPQTDEVKINAKGNDAEKKNQNKRKKQGSSSSEKEKANNLEASEHIIDIKI